MKSLIAIALLASAISCPKPEPIPTPSPSPEPPDCRTLGCPDKAKCELVGGEYVCVSPLPTPEPTPTPTPVSNPCPKPLAPNAIVYLNDKPYGQGFDSTVRVKGDPEFCKLISGVEQNDCHLEGWPKRVACELYLIKGCPIWEYAVANGKNPSPCSDDQSALASCDHFGDPVNRDDPKTPTTGNTLETLKGFEGEPKVCGLQRDRFGPMAGYFTIAHGGPAGCSSSTGPYYQIRACKPDGTNCGPWRNFCK